MSFSKFKHLFVKTRKPYDNELFDCKDGVLACPQCKSLGIVVSDTPDIWTHGYCPNCKHTEQLGVFQDVGLDKALRVANKRLGVECSECGVGSELIVRNCRYGMFIGCDNYPSCKYIMNLKDDLEITPYSGGLFEPMG